MKFLKVLFAATWIMTSLLSTANADSCADELKVYPQASTELLEVLNSQQSADDKIVEVAFFVSSEGVQLRALAKRVKKVGENLSRYTSKGLTIKNSFSNLGMIIVEAPIGTLKKVLSAAIRHVVVVHTFDSTQGVDLLLAAQLVKANTRTGALALIPVAGH